jgi:nitrate/nitrite transport system ATP-binding protein
MTNGPCATIGEILKVPFKRPRDRSAIRNSKEYFELRNHALNFLDRYFTSEE